MKRRITINYAVVNTSIQEDAPPSIPLIETSYQNNRLLIGLYVKVGYATQNGIWVNFFGQMIPLDHYSHFQAYLEVRQGRPVDPMSPSRRGVIKGEALNRLSDFIRDLLIEYFSRITNEVIDPLALGQFYHDYQAQASKLPSFVAVRRRWYESGDDASKMTSLFAPQGLSSDAPPLLLADKARLAQGDPLPQTIYLKHFQIKLGCKFPRNFPPHSSHTY